MTQGTRERLLEAARSVFARRGFDGASIRDITAAAEANLGAVTYHFGSKQALYEAVLEAAFQPVLSRLAALPADPDAHLLDRIESRLRIVFAHLHDNPDLQFLVLQQIGRDGIPAPAARAFSAIFAGIASLVAEGQRRGEVRAGDPTMLAISVVSQPAYFALIARYLLDRLPLPGGSPPWDAIVEHGVGFVRAGLAAQSGAAALARGAHATRERP